MKRFRLTSSVVLLILVCQGLWAADDYGKQLNMAYAAEDSGHYERAISLLLPLLDMVPEDSAQVLADVLSTLANDYYRLGEFDKALEYGRRNLALDEKGGKEENLSSSLNNLAAICSTIGRYEQAEEYLRRGIEIEERLGREDKLAIRLGMLCEVYTLQNRTEEALPLARRALELDQKGGREDKAAIRMSQLGNALVHLQRYDEAEPYLRQAVALLDKYQNQSSLCLSLLALGQAERAMGHTQQAERILERSIHIAQQIGQRHTRMTAYRELAHLNGDLGNTAQAYRYLDAYTQLKDSISTEQVHQQISELQVRYETDKKELELARQKAINDRQYTITLAVCFLLAISLVALLAVFHSLRMKKRVIRLRDEFLRIISHDLKNPTIASQRSLHLLYQHMEKLSLADVRDEVKRMAETADAQVGLLYDLLTWAQLRTNRLNVNPVLLDLNSIVQDVMSQHANQAAIKSVTLNFRPSSGSSALVFADRQTVATILRNLISNAIKFSYAGGAVEVEADAGLLRVTDHGVGMDVNMQTCLRGTSGEDGTGIGFGLVKTLVELNRGTLEIESETGKGTQITVILPQK